jgi:hypothetical protein
MPTTPVKVPIRPIPRLFPSIGNGSPDQLALCGLSFYRRRNRLSLRRSRAKRAQSGFLQGPVDPTDRALAHAYFYAARRAGFRGSFLAAADRVLGRSPLNPVRPT